MSTRDKGGRCVWLTTLVVPKVEKIQGLNLPGTPRATSACRGIPLPLLLLTLILLTWRIWWAYNNSSKWQMGLNSEFKGLNNVTEFLFWKLIRKGHKYVQWTRKISQHKIKKIYFELSKILNQCCQPSGPVFSPVAHKYELIMFNIRPQRTVPAFCFKVIYRVIQEERTILS
jgi:hypothetical protein